MGLALLITLIFLQLVSNGLHYSVMCVASSIGCSTSYCGDSEHTTPEVRFPFTVKGPDQLESCGYSGFDLSCDQSVDRTLIELPSSGNLSVKSIDYTAQEIWVNDLNNCLPKKLLSLNLSNSPFTMVYYQEFSFFNCSSTLVTQNETINFKMPIIIGPIPCLSGLDYFVYAIPINNRNNIRNNVTTTFFAPPKCYMVAQMVKVPVQWPSSVDNETGLSSMHELTEDLRLSWFMPECQSCELHGQMCAMRTNSDGSNVLVCSNVTNKGKPRKLSLTTMIAVILVICSPSIICVVGSLYIWVRTYLRRTPSIPTTTRPGSPVELGLEQINVDFTRQVVRLGLRNESSPEIEPTIVVSEIEEMSPSPLRDEENVCAICMVEYQANDKMGTLPICRHYFHARCINEWLVSRGVLERTCPICRACVG